MCYPFSKFHNFGGFHAAKLDWTTAVFTEKLDGSLIKLYYLESEGNWDSGHQQHHGCQVGTCSCCVLMPSRLKSIHVVPAKPPQHALHNKHMPWPARISCVVIIILPQSFKLPGSLVCTWNEPPVTPASLDIAKIISDSVNGGTATASLWCLHLVRTQHHGMQQCTADLQARDQNQSTHWVTISKIRCQAI